MRARSCSIWIYSGAFAAYAGRVHGATPVVVFALVVVVMRRVSVPCSRCGVLVVAVSFFCPFPRRLSPPGLAVVRCGRRWIRGAFVAEAGAPPAAGVGGDGSAYRLWALGSFAHEALVRGCSGCGGVGRGGRGGATPFRRRAGVLWLGV